MEFLEEFHAFGVDVQVKTFTGLMNVLISMFVIPQNRISHIRACLDKPPSYSNTSKILVFARHALLQFSDAVFATQRDLTIFKVILTFVKVK
jgi:hypothetical protein